MTKLWTVQSDKTKIPFTNATSTDWVKYYGHEVIKMTSLKKTCLKHHCKNTARENYWEKGEQQIEWVIFTNKGVVITFNTPCWLSLVSHNLKVFFLLFRLENLMSWCMVPFWPLPDMQAEHAMRMTKLPNPVTRSLEFPSEPYNLCNLPLI